MSIRSEVNEMSCHLEVKPKGTEVDAREMLCFTVEAMRLKVR